MSTANAQEVMRALMESERLVKMMGTLIPKTKPAHSAPAM